MQHHCISPPVSGIQVSTRYPPATTATLNLCAVHSSSLGGSGGREGRSKRGRLSPIGRTSVSRLGERILSPVAVTATPSRCCPSHHLACHCQCHPDQAWQQEHDRGTEPCVVCTRPSSPRLVPLPLFQLPEGRNTRNTRHHHHDLLLSRRPCTSSVECFRCRHDPSGSTTQISGEHFRLRSPRGRTPIITAAALHTLFQLGRTAG
jgi:hypothetical protein